MTSLPTAGCSTFLLRLPGSSVVNRTEPCNW